MSEGKKYHPKEYESKTPGSTNTQLKDIPELHGQRVWIGTKQGVVTSAGLIHCKCCSSDFTPTGFERHGGSLHRRPWTSIKAGKLGAGVAISKFKQKAAVRKMQTMTQGGISSSASSVPLPITKKKPMKSLDIGQHYMHNQGLTQKKNYWKSFSRSTKTAVPNEVWMNMNTADFNTALLVRRKEAGPFYWDKETHTTQVHGSYVCGVQDLNAHQIGYRDAFYENALLEVHALRKLREFKDARRAERGRSATSSSSKHSSSAQAHAGGSTDKSTDSNAPVSAIDIVAKPRKAPHPYEVFCLHKHADMKKAYPTATQEEYVALFQAAYRKLTPQQLTYYEKLAEQYRIRIEKTIPIYQQCLTRCRELLNSGTPVSTLRQMFGTVDYLKELALREAALERQRQQAAAAARSARTTVTSLPPPIPTHNNSNINSTPVSSTTTKTTIRMPDALPTPWTSSSGSSTSAAGGSDDEEMPAEEAMRILQAKRGQRLKKTNPRCRVCRTAALPGSHLIPCVGCYRRFHPQCLDLAPKTLERIQQIGNWKCIHCTMCEVCKEPTDERNLLFCDGCDRGYHTYCHRPALASPPAGTWICVDCLQNGVVERDLKKESNVSTAAGGTRTSRQKRQ
eukprot:CAMPEP_0177643054 /NCGR_PEP_ID=MMETSP0447-20121125/7950_1 /TAXON_ID=0 /ORGANISM="Stygamoeba regulata, Strain BSH-02190019" /LENGTH=621 /DNA_ID=CAMNT_0019145323 /DNA_START=68 /DNA_END=1933 /DNA_ORIENTATION=-